MIDHDPPTTTGGRDRFGTLSALLIGIVAIVASGLVVIQFSAGLAEARANAQARRLATDITTRIGGSDALLTPNIINGQRALMVSMLGTGRQIVALQGGDAAQGAIGEAEASAGTRLLGIAFEMGAPPDASSPLDAWARDVIASDVEDLTLLSVAQGEAADLAHAASARSSLAVMGLSLVALAGVVVGLAAVLGGGRTGRWLLVLGWIAAGGAVVLLGFATGLVAI